MRTLAIALAATLLIEPLTAAEREIVRTGWNGFQQQVAARNLNGRSVRIALAGGGEVKTGLRRVADAGLLVRSTRATKQWQTAKGEALIPRDQVATVTFNGKLGHRGLIGGLAGLGAGAGVGAAIATSTDCYEGPCIILLPAAGAAMAGLGALTGYLVGRATGTPAPEFILVP